MTSGRVGQGRVLGIGAVALAMGLAAVFASVPVRAGNAIGPALQVNAEVVTTYELDQRIRLMEVLNQPGDVPLIARRTLIDDRLRHAAAKAQGVTVSDEEVVAGMTEFAARGQLTLDQLLQLLDKNGVDAVALRDFVRSGLEWRNAVRARYQGKVSVSEAEIDRAIAAGVAAGGELQVLLSEIVLPTGTDQGDPAILAARITEGAHSLRAFQVFAQKYSKSDSAKAGGQLDWRPLSSLPPNLAGAIEALKPGEMTVPLPVEGGIAIYWLRDESEGPGEGTPSYDLDILRLAYGPGGEAALQSLAGKALRCGDLYPAARGLPEEALVRETLAERSLPADLAGVLAGMDPGEAVVRTAANGAPELVMLCARLPQTAIPPSRDAVRVQLVNRKLALLADGWLESLRSNAIVTDK